MYKTIALSAQNHELIISAALQVLTDGGLVIFPTETVYGVLVDATNQKAVEKLLKFKKRRAGKPISIACNNLEMAQKYVQINEQAQKIYDTLLPGPITVISQAKSPKILDSDQIPAEENIICPEIISEFSTLGIRIPDYPLLIDLIKHFNKPVTATSANLSGQASVYKITDLLKQISQKRHDQIDLIIDAGTLPKRPPSIVIDTTASSPIYFRDNDHPTKGQESANNDQEERFICQNAIETQILAQKLIFRSFDQIEAEGLVITLDGELGAGKTTFTQGIAKFLDIDQKISSPTYTYIKEYNFTKDDLSGNLFHLDVWKINTASEVESLEIKKLFGAGKITIIEWWSQISDFITLPPNSLKIKISELPDESRQIFVLRNIK